MPHLQARRKMASILP